VVIKSLLPSGFGLGTVSFTGTRDAKSGYDYRYGMDEVKSTVDALRDYSNKKDLGKEL